MTCQQSTCKLNGLLYATNCATLQDTWPLPRAVDPEPSKTPPKTLHKGCGRLQHLDLEASFFGALIGRLDTGCWV